MSSRFSSGAHTITPFPLSPGAGPGDQPQAQGQPQAEAQSPVSPRGTCSVRKSMGKRSVQETRRSSEPSPDLSRSPSARSARMSSSLLPALRLAGLAPDPDSRPREMRSSRSRDPPPKSKALLTLKLSGSSFLDSVIRDDRSKEPLYILETSNEVTSIYRLDQARELPVKAATVQWPLHPVRVKGKSGRTIQISGGSWREAEDILKSGPLGNTAYAKTPLDHHLLPLLTVSSSSSIRKFNLPHYPNSLKWKLIPGNCFCVRPCLHASFGASPLLSPSRSA